MKDTEKKATFDLQATEKKTFAEKMGNVFGVIIAGLICVAVLVGLAALIVFGVRSMI